MHHNLKFFGLAIFLMTTIASASHDRSPILEKPIVHALQDETPYPKISLFQKWAYISSLVPNAKRFKPDLSSMTKQLSFGAIIGACGFVTLAVLVLLATQENPSIDSNSFKYFIQDARENPLTSWTIVTMTGAATGICITGITTALLQFIKRYNNALEKRNETKLALETLLAAPKQMIPEEIQQMIKEFRKDKDGYRLCRRINATLKWYEKIYSNSFIQQALSTN